jgi:tetratricopeptide (TPR) repeat protein
MTHPASGLPTYRPSGHVPTAGSGRVALIGLPLVCVTGGLYGMLVSARWHTAKVLIAAVLVSILVAALVCMVLKAAHSRSSRFNTGAAWGLAFAFLWSRWVVALAQLVGWAAVWAAASPLRLPLELFVLAQRLPESGGDHAWFGWYLLAWLLEAILFGGFFVAVARDQAGEPYSERTEAWADKAFEGELYLAGGASAGLGSMLASEGTSVLLRMEPAALLAAAPIASQWWTVRVIGRAVPADESACWLDVAVVVNEREQDGKIKSTKQPVVMAWQVNQQDFEAVRGCLAVSAPELGLASEPPAASAEAEEGIGEHTTPIALQPAVTALDAGNFSLAYALAQAQRQHPQAGVQLDATRLCAIALARMERWAEAFDEYHRLFDLAPDAHTALDLATTSIKFGELLRGQAWFERAEQLNLQSHQMPSAALRTAFLSALSQEGELAACLPHIEWLAQAYRTLRLTDSHLLWTRGLPFFSVFLQKSEPVLRHAFGDAEARNWYLRLRDAVEVSMARRKSTRSYAPGPADPGLLEKAPATSAGARASSTVKVTAARRSRS